jgi:sulfite reductase alpha subunit-like flavoprotein
MAAIKTKPTAPGAKTQHVAASTSHSKTTAKTASHKASGTATSSSSSRHSRKASLKTVAAKPKFRGQQGIDSARMLEIQQALIREHYLNGEPTGEWDQATREALTRLQEANHWQTKIVPDARALIKLGLGPTQQNLLNPESAAIAPSYRGLDRPADGGSN